MDAKARAEQHFAAAEHDLRDLRTWMYEHPEVAFEEQETSRHLAAFLAARGFTVEYPAYGLETAFAARAGASGPRWSSAPSSTPCRRWATPAATT